MEANIWGRLGCRNQEDSGDLPDREQMVRGVSALLAAMHFVVQPLLHGGVGDLAEAEAFFLGGGSLLLWVWAWARSGRVPRLPLLLWVPLGLLLVSGWVAAANPQFAWNTQLRSFESRDAFVPFLPSCVDAETAAKSMIWSTLQIFLLCSLWDHLRHPSGRSHVWNAVRWGGAALLFLAILQKAAESDRVFFTGARVSNAFFGSFFYSGSAAAYINLLMPAYALAVVRQQQITFSWACLAACLVCLFCNTSRIGFVVGFLQIIVLLVLLLRSGYRSKKPLGRAGRPRPVAGRHAPAVKIGGAFAAAVAGFLVLFPTPPILQKWKLLPQQWGTHNTRLQAWKIGWAAAQDASVWGMGAGCFPLVFPHYAATVPHYLQGRWGHAHCDYLEFWIERGAFGLGTAAMFALATLWRVKRRCPPGTGCVMTALAGVGLHAAADFPFQNPSVQLLVGLWLAQAWQPGTCGNAPPPEGVWQRPSALPDQTTRNAGDANE